LDQADDEVGMKSIYGYTNAAARLGSMLRSLICAVAMVATALAPSLLSAQDSAEPRDRVLVEVELKAGTNMAAAVAPDGVSLMINVQGVLWRLARSGGEATELTPAEMDAYEPAWSPDGRHVAFYAFTEDNFSIWMMNADGTDRVQLTNNIHDARYPSFSPDGGTIYYASDADEGYGIWSLNLADRIERKLVDASETGYLMPLSPRFSGAGNAAYPVVSPDGDTLAFVIDGPQNQLVVRDLSGGPIRTLYSSGELGAPMWSANGDALYVVAIDGQETELVRVSLADATAEAVVAGGDIFPFRPSLSPDGVVFYTADGAIKTINPNGAPGANVDFSAFVVLDRTPYARRSYALADTTPREALGIVDPVLSPDGSQAAFTALGDLWVANLASGQVNNMTDNQ
jgi:dipeptidyl aminopeptidase/acylaminoacyl peptidase